MFNLILKDILSQKKDSILPLILFSAFIFVYKYRTLTKITPIITSILILGGFLNSYSNDITKNHHVLTNSLPITRKEIVIYKYLFAVLYASILLSATVFCIKIITLLHPSLNLSLFSFRNMLTLFLFYLLICSIIFPIYYEIQNKTLISIITSALTCSIITCDCSPKSCLSNIIYSISENKFVSCPLIIILYIASMFLSIYIYESKDLI